MSFQINPQAPTAPKRPRETLEKSFQSSLTLPREPDILIVGDGDMSFTETFVMRRINGIGLDSKRPHPNFGQRVITSEYKSKHECLSSQAAFDRVQRLEKLGVTVMFGVDATNLHHTFPNRVFSRIQWNCPDVHTQFCGSNKLPETIRKFALSASHLQKEGGKLHLTLIAPHGSPDYRVWQAFHYRVVKAMNQTGYTLDSQKESGPELRYFFDSDDSFCSWNHAKTLGDRKITAFDTGVMELIFNRTLKPGATTEPRDIRGVNGFFKRSNSFGDFKVESREPYYSKRVRSPLSSDSDCEPSSPLKQSKVTRHFEFDSSEEDVFPQSPTKIIKRSSYAEITAK